METSNSNGTGYGISFFLKRGRILIYRTALKAIGSPRFIRLLVSRKDKRIAVQCCEEIDRDSYAIPAYDTWDQFEISSTKFIGLIYKLAKWDQDKNYRILGYAVEKYHLILYCLDEAQEITDTELGSKKEKLEKKA